MEMAEHKYECDELAGGQSDLQGALSSGRRVFFFPSFFLFFSFSEPVLFFLGGELQLMCIRSV
jgi:hypothetical protein